MTQPRATLISLDATPWYHLVNRCVRRATCAARIPSVVKCYEHRRGWIVDRLHQLTSVFAIDVAAYAVMSNHYHLVVRVDAARAQDAGGSGRGARRLGQGADLVRDTTSAAADALRCHRTTAQRHSLQLRAISKGGLELVKTTGRCQRAGKYGLIETHVPQFLERLNIDPEAFIAVSSTLLKRFGSAVGTPTSLTSYCAARQARHLRGMRTAREVFARWLSVMAKPTRNVPWGWVFRCRKGRS